MLGVRSDILEDFSDLCAPTLFTRLCVGGMQLSFVKIPAFNRRSVAVKVFYPSNKLRPQLENERIYRADLQYR